ncbi:MurR/RpiR family transcriptional regulator [Streptomyces sp. NPDC004752]
MPATSVTAIDLFLTVNRLRERVLNELDPHLLNRAVEVVDNAKRIMVLAGGYSAGPALEAARRLAGLGYWVQGPTDGVAHHLAGLGPGDAVILISHTGETPDTVAFAERAKEMGATTIAITNFAASSLGKNADLTIAVTGADHLGLGWLGSRTDRIESLLVGFDCIYAGLGMLKDDARIDSARALIAPAEPSSPPGRRTGTTR